MDTLRVLELYSGIGGMHFALKESGIAADVVAAVDINTAANEVYRHNFPHTPLWSKTIECLMLEDFDSLGLDMILMSPPCQPFTRIGLQGDVADPRAKSFLYILHILPRLSRPPRFLLLENVKGFETSSARDSLVKTLKDCGYSYQEFLLSPTCLGIPNSRLRYFLIAQLVPLSFSFQTTTEILEAFPDVPVSTNSQRGPAPEAPPMSELDSMGEGGGRFLYKLERPSDLQRKRYQDSDGSVHLLREFLQDEVEIGDDGQYLLPPRTLLRYALVMDIVQPTCRRSVCFTKGYGHYVEGTGSVLQGCMDVKVEEAFRSFDSLSEEERLEQLSRLKLRYFTPREIANLMGFPSCFDFPKQTSVKQRYRLLGNSLNVHVVAKLIKLMVT